MSKEADQIARIQAGLGCSEAEAREIYEYDRAVDHSSGGLEHDLTSAQNKVAQQFTKTGTRKTPTAYKFTKRERKPNELKSAIIAAFATFLAENEEFSAENVEITNKERMIAFESGGERFELTLTQKRKPKN